MAKSKKKYPKKRVNNTHQNSNNITVKHNKNVYTDEYMAKKEYQNTEKSVLFRLFVIVVACVVFLGFVVLPLIQ